MLIFKFKLKNLLYLLFIFSFLTLFLSSCCYNSTNSSCPSCTLEENSSQIIWDPLEPLNRKVFWFNDKFHTHISTPVAKAHDYIFPSFIKNGISNFLENIKYPIYVVSDILKFNFNDLPLHTKRFGINSTIGVLGIMDIAKGYGLKKKRTNLGIALGTLNISGGPYLIIPLLGPSNLRDVFGSVGEYYLNPLSYPFFISELESWNSIYYISGTAVLPFVNEFNKMRSSIEKSKKASVDYYLFVRSAYYQMQNHMINANKNNLEKKIEDDFEDLSFDEEDDNEDEELSFDD